MRLGMIVISVLCLVSCTTEEQKLEKKLLRYDAFMADKLLPDSIPDSVVVMLHNFAVQYPQNPKSEKYLYIATVITESNGNFFETAKWCEDFVKLYPKSKHVLKGMVAAASNYEKCGSVEKAIEFYEKAAAEFPKSDLAQQGKRNAEMLRMGLVTPEQQFQYIMKMKDSLGAAGNKP